MIGVTSLGGTINVAQVGYWNALCRWHFLQPVNCNSNGQGSNQQIALLWKLLNLPNGMYNITFEICALKMMQRFSCIRRQVICGKISSLWPALVTTVQLWLVQLNFRTKASSMIMPLKVTGAYITYNAGMSYPSSIVLNWRVNYKLHQPGVDNRFSTQMRWVFP